MKEAEIEELAKAVSDSLFISPFALFSGSWIRDMNETEWTRLSVDLDDHYGISLPADFGSGITDFTGVVAAVELARGIGE